MRRLAVISSQKCATAALLHHPSASSSLLAGFAVGGPMMMCRRGQYSIPPTAGAAAAAMGGSSSSSASTPPYPGYIADEEDEAYAAVVAAEKAVGQRRAERMRQPMAVTADEDQVDPFRVGYNMGMQNVQLETLRHKLDDNQELVKSHLASLRETTRTNYDSLRRLHNEHHRLILDEIKSNDEKLTAKFVAYGNTFTANEETMRELSKQQFESLQKHVDDRLENIKDTVKIGSLLLLALNLCTLFLISQHQSNGGGAHGTGAPHHGKPAMAASNAPQGAPPSVSLFSLQQKK